MPGIAEALIAHHRRIDELLAAVDNSVRAGDWDALEVCLAQLREALLAHFVIEEDHLFPAFEAATGLRDATSELRSEHEQLRAVVTMLIDARSRRDVEDCRTDCETLALLYRQHKEKEEILMYPAFERTLSAGAAADFIRHADPDGSVLDVRGLDPPEPIRRICRALARDPTRTLRVLIHREPLPLYELLKQQGYVYRTQPLAEGGFEIRIDPGR